MECAVDMCEGKRKEMNRSALCAEAGRLAGSRAGVHHGRWKEASTVVMKMLGTVEVDKGVSDEVRWMKGGCSPKQ